MKSLLNPITNDSPFGNVEASQQFTLLLDFKLHFLAFRGKITIVLDSAIKTMYVRIELEKLHREPRAGHKIWSKKRWNKNSNI